VFSAVFVCLEIPWADTLYLGSQFLWCVHVRLAESLIHSWGRPLEPLGSRRTRL